MTVSAVFGYGIEKVVTEPLFQYDIGQKLNISGLEVDETTEIHFKSPYSKIAKIATGTLEGSTMTVDIPDEFLENSGNGLVWVCLTDENAVTTIRTISIPIKERAKPDGYVLKGDGTYKKFDEEIAKLNAGFKNCEKKLNIGAVTSVNSLISYKETGTIYTGTIAYQADYSGDLLMFVINSCRYLLTSDGHLWRFNSLTTTTPIKLTYTAAEVESLLDDYDEAVIAKLNLKADKATTLAGYGITDAYDKTYLDEALKNKLDKMPFDTAPKENSPNYITSGTLYNSVNTINQGINKKADKADVTNQLSELKDDISLLNSMCTFIDTEWENGIWNYNPPSKTSGYKNRIRTAGVYTFERQRVLNVAEGFNLYVYRYDENDTYIGQSNTAGGSTIIFQQGEKVRLVIRRTTEVSGEIANITEFKNAVFEKISDTNVNINLFSSVLAVDGYLNNDGGITYTTQNGEKTTGYIPIFDEKKIAVKTYGLEGYSKWQAFTFYTQDKTFISPRVVPTLTNNMCVVRIPDGAKYFRFSTRLYEVGLVKIEFGDHSTAYSFNPADVLYTQLTELKNTIQKKHPLPLASLILGRYTIKYVSFDSISRTVTFPRDTIIVNPNDNNPAYYILNPNSDLVVSYSEQKSTAIKLLYDTSDGTCRCVGYNDKHTENDILLCSFRDDVTAGSDLSVSITVPYTVNGMFMGRNLDDFVTRTPYDVGTSIKSVNHRGYNSVAPENTLSAFKQSRKHSFLYVETDVRFTSDGVPVLLHDETINRTARNADGSTISETIKIADITLAQAKEYVFCGTRYNNYPTERIPTFEEFLLLCKRLGLNAWVELKAYSQAQIAVLVNLAKKHAMLDSIIWLGAVAALQLVSELYPKATLAVLTNVFSENIVNLKNNMNHIIVDCELKSITDDLVSSCIENDIELGIWNLGNAEQLLSANPYITCFTADSIIASKVFYEKSV